MNNKNIAKNSLYQVMGVKRSTHEKSEEKTTEEKTLAEKTVQPNLDNPQWDKVATLKYLGATLIQIAVLAGLLRLMDVLLDLADTEVIPQVAITIATCLFFAFVTLRSRLFSLLDNTRDTGRYTSIQRPGWAPPPLAFPIVWMSIAVLRIVSAYLVWSTMDQTFFCLPLILYVTHLSSGDTWNTIFTVEGRLGAAVPVVILGPLLSVVAVTVSYFQTLPLAGWVIFPSLVWLAIATVLCASLWQLNGKEPMYPLTS